MSSGLRVAIVGAGVIGLSVGWRLAKAGCSVDVYDKASAGRGASWAAAGMLAASAEAVTGADAAFELGRRSQELWPRYVAELEAVAGFAIDYRTQGTLIPAFGPAQLDRLHQTFGQQQSLGAPVHWLSAAEARAREPSLSDQVSGAIFAPQDVQVDNRKFVAAVKFALLAAGGRLHEHQRVTAVTITDRHVSQLVLDARQVPADLVILAAGLGSEDIIINGLPDIPMIPVKGEMLAFRGSATRPLLHHVVRAPGAYLVPRNDASVILGATSVIGCADEAMTAGGLTSLLLAAQAAVPTIADYPVKDMWTGVRPGTPDDLPIMGLCGLSGLILATGHYRNGILWAPITAALLTRLIVDGRQDRLLDPFALQRFARETGKTGAAPPGSAARGAS